MKYAEIWRRVFAKLIDIFIIGLIYPICAFIATIGFSSGALQGVIGTYENFMTMISMFIILQLLAACLYSTLLVAKSGKTIGKRILGIKVVTSAGDQPSLSTALIRFVSEFLSGLILLLGYLIALIDSEKRTLHDRLAQTRVVRN